MCQDAPGPLLPGVVSILVGTYLPPARTCPGCPALRRGCSCSPVSEDFLVPEPSAAAPICADASLLPARTCLDHTTLSPRCSCSSMWKDALGPVIPSEYLRRPLPFSTPHCNVPVFHNIDPSWT